jgi:uncharacterized Tic20 family protein
MEQEAVSADDKNLALLAHLLGIFTSFIGALIIWLVKKDAPFVEDQAKEALNFQITVAIAYAASSVLALIGIGVVLWGVVALLNLIFCILGTMAASRGEKYRYPVAIRLVK